MSKGPDKWQRLILAELENKEAFYLRRLLGQKCTKAQYNALLRAMQELEAAGKINVKRFLWGSTAGTGKTVVYRTGTVFSGKDRKYLDDKYW
jgi:RecG-like helicase